MQLQVSLWETQTQSRGQWQKRQRLEGGRHQLRMPGAPEAGRSRKDLPRAPPNKSRLCPHPHFIPVMLVLNVLSSEIWEKTYLLFEIPSLWSFVTVAQRMWCHTLSSRELPLPFSTRLHLLINCLLKCSWFTILWMLLVYIKVFRFFSGISH